MHPYESDNLKSSDPQIFFVTLYVHQKIVFRYPASSPNPIDANGKSTIVDHNLLGLGGKAALHGDLLLCGGVHLHNIFQHTNRNDVCLDLHSC